MILLIDVAGPTAPLAADLPPLSLPYPPTPVNAAPYATVRRRHN